MNNPDMIADIALERLKLDMRVVFGGNRETSLRGLAERQANQRELAEFDYYFEKNKSSNQTRLFPWEKRRNPWD